MPTEMPIGVKVRLSKMRTIRFSCAKIAPTNIAVRKLREAERGGGDVKPKRPRDRKNFAAWARVSSRPQEVEGTSLEVQEAGMQTYAANEGGDIARLWKITETGSKAERRD